MIQDNRKKYAMYPGIEWLVENKVIIGKPEGNPSPDELQQASDTYQILLDASDALLVHVLVDESKLDTLPVSLKVLVDALDFLKHARLGWFILYGNDDQMKKFVSSTLTGITKVRHRRFATLEESLEFLVTMDATLPTVQEMLDSVSS
jgi:hypothetical protein